jgi:formylglycine-generating enzyme required for sulfatase activity
MVSVPAGTFQRDATAANTSTVSAFRMSDKEITMEQFVAVTGLANPSTSFTTVVNGPVQTTNWYHTLVFCNKLSIAEGLVPVYSISGSTNPTDWGAVPTSSNATWDAVVATRTNTGYRLPTEMEWMWAAMGATSGSGYSSPTYLTGYGKLFAGSNSILADGSGGTTVVGDYAWYDVNSGSTTHPVGTTGGTPAKANELVLYDMSGNVWEWCWDWYAAYPNNNLTDYLGAASGADRVARGGGWYNNASFCAVAYRYNYNPFRQSNHVGFRVVRP